MTGTLWGLALALAFFIAVHLAPAVPGLRAAPIGTWGRQVYRALFSRLALAGLQGRARRKFNYDGSLYQRAVRMTRCMFPQTPGGRFPSPWLPRACSGAQSRLPKGGESRSSPSGVRPSS